MADYEAMGPVDGGAAPPPPMEPPKAADDPYAPTMTKSPAVNDGPLREGDDVDLASEPIGSKRKNNKSMMKSKVAKSKKKGKSKSREDEKLPAKERKKGRVNMDGGSADELEEARAKRDKTNSRLTLLLGVAVLVFVLCFVLELVVIAHWANIFTFIPALNE